MTTTVGATSAEAVVGPNPYVDVTIDRSFDGTGHGTSDATFVNGENGYVPGDNNADDGVVSSNDIVGYKLSVSIHAGPARTIALTVGSTGGLTVTPESAGLLCNSMPGVDMALSGETCLMTVRAGATALIERDMQMLAADSKGVALDDQRVRVTTGISDMPVYSTVESDPVTVVSAPKVDLAFTQTNTSVWTSDAGMGVGSLGIEALPLRPLGYSPTKGVALDIPWNAQIDVSSFPAGTTWRFLGDLVEVVDGKIPVSGSGVDSVRVDYVFPDGMFPEQEPGTTSSYPVHLVVPADAFSSESYLNNGDGTQPGGGMPSTFDTFNRDLGSRSGYGFRNNDHALQNVSRTNPSTGEIFSHELVLPRSLDISIFEPGNLRFDQAPVTEQSPALFPRSRGVGSDFTMTSRLHSDAITDSGVAVLAEVWDTNESRIRGQVSVTHNGQALPRNSYTLQWASVAPSGSVISHPNRTDGWVSSPNPIPNAQAVRVIFNDGVVQAGTGDYALVTPLVQHADYAQGSDPLISSSLHGSIGSVAGTLTSSYLVEWPVDPTLNLTHTMNQATYAPGDTVVYGIKPELVNPSHVGDGFQSRIAVELDRCVADPINTSSDTWSMEVVDGVAGPSGRICGDDESTPTSLVFTPAGDPATQAIRWSQRDRKASLPEITYSTRVAFRAVDAIVASSTLDLDNYEDLVLGVGGATAGVVAQTSVYASMFADFPTTEFNKNLKWTVDLSQRVTDGVGETVIALPRNNDGSLWDDTIDPGDAYSGARESSFTGEYTVAGVNASADDISDTVEIFFTVDENPSLNPSEGTWYALSDEGVGSTPGIAGATAVKVVAEGGANFSNVRLHVDLLPEGNAADDVYVLWVGETALTGEGNVAPRPWPNQIEIASSVIAGTVFWDEDMSSSFSGSEAGIAGVDLGLFPVVDGVIAESSVMETVTDEDGKYVFDRLHAGQYVVQIQDRGGNLPESALSYYNEQIGVENTYTYENKRAIRAEDVSSAITLDVGSDIDRVDFGFFQPDPGVDVSKSVVSNTCRAGVCDITWSVDVENTGNTAITNGTLTDVMSSPAYDVEAQLTSVQRTAFGSTISAGGDGSGYMIDADGRAFGFSSRVDFAGSDVGSHQLPLEVLSHQVGPDGEHVVKQLDGVREIVSDDSAAAFLMEDGTVYIAGSRLLQNQDSQSMPYTVQVVTSDGTPLQDVVSVALSRYAAIALTGDGTVHSWGDGSRSPLGGGSTQRKQYPTPVLTASGAPLTDIVEIASIEGLSLALSSDGRLYSWGLGVNFSGGNGSSSQAPYAATVNTAEGVPLEGVVSFALRSRLSLTDQVIGGAAVTADGFVYSWGAHTNPAFSLSGNGRSTDGSYASRVMIDESTDLTNARKVVGGGETSSVLLEDGTVFVWGASSSIAGTGQGGDGLFARPVISSNGDVLSDASDIYGGIGASYAVRNDGTAFSWGSGQMTAHSPLGNMQFGGEFSYWDGTPVTDIQGISSQAGLTMVLLNDGSILSLGSHRNSPEWLPDIQGFPGLYPSEMSRASFEPITGVDAIGGDMLYVRDDVLYSFHVRNSAQYSNPVLAWPEPFHADGLNQVNIASFSTFKSGHGDATFVDEDGRLYNYAGADDKIVGRGYAPDYPYISAESVMEQDPYTTDPYLAEPFSGIIHSASNVATDGTNVYTWGVAGMPLGQSDTDLNDSFAANKVIANRLNISGYSSSQNLREFTDFTKVFHENGSTAMAALTEAGKLYTWGDEHAAIGQGVIDYSRTNGYTARQIQLYAGNSVTPGPIVDAVQTQTGMLALTEDGYVLGWGDVRLGGGYSFADDTGQSASLLMRGSTPLTDVTDISASPSRMGVVHGDGEVLFWEVDGDLLGNSFTKIPTVATLADGALLTGATKVSVSDANVAVLIEDGRVASIGDRSLMAIGSGVSGQSSHFEFAKTSADDYLTGVSDVVSNEEGGMALMDNTMLYTWGTASGRVDYYQDGRDGLYAAPLEEGLPVPFSGALVMPSNAISAGEVTQAGDFTEREYRMPVIEPGDTANVLFTAKVNQRTGVRQVVGNQAWFTSPSTPIAGILPEGQISPDAPVLPRFEDVIPEGISGNATCNTDADGGGQALADSCDQVAVALPAVLPGALGEPGGASGMMWLDVNKDGIRQDDEPALGNANVTLMREGMVRGTTVTDANGDFVFDAVPSASGYTVVFDVLGTSPTAEHLATVGVDAGTFSATKSLDRGVDQSWMTGGTFSTGEFEIIPGVDEEHLNGGVVLMNTALRVDKTSVLGDPANLEIDENGMTAPLQVEITVTNMGNESLGSFTWGDETLSGVAVEDIRCTFGGGTWSLLPGFSSSCVGTLPSFEYGTEDHSNVFTVSALGFETSTPVTGSDTFTAVAQGETSWTMSKSSDPTSGSYVAPGSEITYTLTATNTGDLPLVDMSIVDDMTDVLAKASLVGDLDPALQLSGDVVVWNLPEVAPGDSVAIDLVVVVTDGLYGATLTNTAYGQGPVAPDVCTLDEPCVTEHMTSPWPGALPLPVLGNVAFIVLVLAGVGLLGAGVTYSVISRRKKASTMVSDQG